jgi:hypothetical protein
MGVALIVIELEPLRIINVYLRRVPSGPGSSIR